MSSVLRGPAPLVWAGAVSARYVLRDAVDYMANET
ncbi:hypothetical protein TM48_00402 [Mycobacterium shottsii]|nr:hypothetical protein TM48_00402 [Mycobacterium shottsii]BEH74532.1 hypothetical protein YM3MPS_03350 [Mycobacterium pseudoshottsii]